jgi:hypothetical protein
VAIHQPVIVIGRRNFVHSAMTYTLSGADIHGFYAALGVELPQWSTENAMTRCAFDPDAHNRGDRDPSLSISLISGAYNCHACCAKGGAYDAALALGHDPASAMRLLIRYGLAPALERDQRRGDQHAGDRDRQTARPSQPPASRTQLRVSASQLQRWQRQLLDRPDVLKRLSARRGWTADTVRHLELGLDRWQITIPVRDQHDQLVALIRYRPHHPAGHPKIWAARGSRRALFPHPAVDNASHVLLVEGEPDAIAARSRGLPAIAIPGASGWDPRWGELFSGRAVTIAFDADLEGRTTSAAVAHALREHTVSVVVADLAPDRDDGYDLTDWLITRPGDAHGLLEELHRQREVTA